MRHRLSAIAVATLSVLAVPRPAEAQDDPTRLLDLSQPKVVVKAMQDAGYKAELKINSDGDPYVASAANGTEFTVEFYGCKTKDNCSSYQFSSWYKAEPIFTAALANDWNSQKRFLRVSVGKDGALNEWIDFSAVGKTTYANFADQIDWYQTMDADLVTFLKVKRDAAQKK